MSNLIPCPDCGREISPQAPTCPQCGRPFILRESYTPPAPSSTSSDVASGILKAIGVIILLALAAGAIVWGVGEFQRRDALYQRGLEP